MAMNAELIGLSIDLVVVLTLVFGIYRPRHRKSDLALSYVVLNIGVFGAVALLEMADGGLALGMGLFGILSIIRLRSTAISQTEVAYYFVVLVLGTVNALGGASLVLLLSLNALLVLALAVLDRGPAAPAAPPAIKQRVILDTIHVNPLMLRADLIVRLGTTAFIAVVEEIDYSRGVTILSLEMTDPDPIEPPGSSLPASPASFDTVELPPVAAPRATAPLVSAPPVTVSHVQAPSASAPHPASAPPASAPRAAAGHVPAPQGGPLSPTQQPSVETLESLLWGPR